MYDKTLLLEYLDKSNIDYTLYSHPPINSHKDSENMPKMQGAVLKNLVLTNKNKDLVLYTLPLFGKANLKLLGDSLGLKRLTFSKVSDLCFLGIPPGMVSPFCLLNDLNKNFIYVQDSALDKYDILNCHPMLNSFSVDIKREVLEELIQKTHVINKIGVCSEE